MDTIQIKCPFCGAVLKAKDSAANAGKKITCPVCRHVGVYEDFKKVGEKPAASDETEIPGLKKPGRKVSFSIVDKTTGCEYKLKDGKNLVGRMTYSAPPKAGVPIRTEDRGFSREHIYIEVSKAVDGITYCYASNASNKNPTYVNERLLQDGDSIGLSAGDIIKSSATVLVLKRTTDSSDDPDATEL